MLTAGIIAAKLFHAGDAGATGEHFGDGFHLDFTQAPASRKDVQHWLAVHKFLSGRGIKPDNMGKIKHQPSAGG